MFRRALAVLSVTCVCATLVSAGAEAAATDIVLYAQDATNLRGNWSRGADASAAGGQLLTSTDKGWSNTVAAQPSPADSVEFVFSAPAGTTYHFWLRMRASANSKYNDSLFVQFSDALDVSGAPLFAIGTAKALTVNLANDSTGGRLHGWGWQDRAYWLAQPVTLRFATGGTHTLRIQTREDGVQIDQVVLSHVTYLVTAPGPVTSDATIVPKQAATLPAPWTTQAVGATVLPGNATYAAGAYTVVGSGADIWGTADAFQLVSQPVGGDTQIVARVVGLQNTNANAKAGLMLRQTSSAASAQVLLDVKPNGEVEFMTRPAPGAATTYLTGGTQATPAWVKLSRIGASVSGWTSPDGVNWMRIGTTSFPTDGGALMGLAVTSHDTAQFNTATFDMVSVTLPPATPASPTPAAGVVGIGTSAAVTWTAAGATSYEIAFGTTNPPSPVAADLSSPSFSPASLANGITHYWQIIARNGAGTTAGPVWSFKTMVAAPAVPTIPAPANGVTGSALNTTVSWSAATATSYDLAFGTTNPPATAATNLVSASFQPARLANGTTYYWQVNARNDGGTTAGPIWSFKTLASPVTTPPDGTIVLYAVDVSNVRGNWALVADPTAAGGQALTSADRGWSNTAAPLAAPADSFEFIVNAPAATPYHVWLRMRAAANSKYNDSVFVQWSDAAGADGAALYGIGTTNGLTVNLAADGTGAGLSGWGWQDGAYWLTQSTTIRFASAGPHTLRIQTREDGASIDQIVLSPSTYLTSPPGPTANDATILTEAVPTPAPGTSPTVYNAISDRNAYAKPALPQLGAAGFSFIDPTFGSTLMRVTDGATRPGMTNRSYRVPSNAHLAAWNASSTAFFVESNDGTIIPFSFDPATMTASRIQQSSSGNGGLTLGFYVEPQFSLVSPNLIFGVASGGNNRTVTQYDFTTGAYRTVLDLDTIMSSLAGTYVGGMMTGGLAPENLMVFFGGQSQDAHFYALWAPVDNPAARKVLNTVSSTINGQSTNLALNFHLHSAQIDKSGRYVFLYPTGVDLGAPRYASQVYVWDTHSDTIVAITSGGKDGGAQMHPGGHDAAGFGYWVNQDCCSSSSWDAAQWQFRSLASVGQTSDLISPVLATKEIYLADHISWNNARPDALVPVISSTYRYSATTAPWRAWDEEIIGIDTTGGIGGIVYRFAHHRSLVASDADPATPYFWYEPIANVSRDGKWVLFTSNWEKTLGKDSAEGTFRQDVFLVRLTPQP